MPSEAKDFRTMYFDLVESSQDLGCRVTDLLAEREDLKRRLAESEAGDDPPVCSLQFPDGTMPCNAREVAEGWKRWYVESEAGAAVLRAVIQKLCACDSKEEAWSELNRTKFEATRYYTGREFLAAARKCQEALVECDRPGADDTNYRVVVVHRREALARIKRFLGDA